MNVKIVRLILVLCSFLGLASTLPLQAQQASRSRLEADVTELASDRYLGRGLGSPEGVMAAEYIIQSFRESGITPLNDNYRHPFSYRKGAITVRGNNIVGYISGSDPELKDEYIILGAHYDHEGWELSDGDTVIYNGADDNASGVATIMEVGRLLASERENLGRSVVLIAFDGEESGLIGSKQFVKDSMMDFSKVKAMFSVDMVGMYDAHGGLDMLGFKLIDHYQDILDATLKSANIKVGEVNSEVVVNTDTQPFGKIGVPAIHLFTGLESPYHKPEDDSDLLDYDGMATVASFLARLVLNMSAWTELDKSAQMESFESHGSLKRFNPGFTLNMGSTFHDYPDEFYKAKRLFAAQAGITLETRITQWLAIQPEILYDWGGSQSADGNFRTHSLTTPVSLLFTTPDPDGNGVRFYWQIGGYYSYGFADWGSDVDVDFVNTYSDTEYGFLFGFGLEVMKFRIGFTSFDSWTNRFQDSAGGNIRTHGAYGKIGWIF